MTAAAERLDARIRRCPRCDAWAFDGDCQTCAAALDVEGGLFAAAADSDQGAAWARGTDAQLGGSCCGDTALCGGCTAPPPFVDRKISRQTPAPAASSPKDFL